MTFTNYRASAFRRHLNACALSTALMMTSALNASAMDLKDALSITLATNPEIAESAANRRAIDFEYEQAKRLSRPSIILEGRAGPEWVDSRTTRTLGNDEDVLFGRQASITIQQNLFNFGRNESERDRQASRVDAAAQRVWERSELVSLDVVQSYFDVLRLRSILGYADQNISFHDQKATDISRSVAGGVRSKADEQQSQERLSAARISMNETEEALEIAESTFMRLVGRDIGTASLPPSITAQVPKSLGEALRQGRESNPTLHIARADLDTARAEYRKSKADTKPELFLEVAGRTGENIGGFETYSNDVRAQVVFRHEFRGGIKSSAVQEHLNRVDETRQRLTRLERNVDSLVREAWATRTKTSTRRSQLQNQVSEGTQLLGSYQREFGVGRRTLLDILDAQSSLFQAQTSLVTAEHADSYAQYRLLASTGRLLEVLDLAPRREANAKLRSLEGTEDTPVADAEPRRYPKHYDETMGEGQTWSPNFSGLSNVQISPVQRQWTQKVGDPRPAARTAEIFIPTNKPVPASPAPAVAPPVVDATIVKMASLDASPAFTTEAIPEPAIIAAPTPNIEPVNALPAPRIYGDYISAEQYSSTNEGQSIELLEPVLMSEITETPTVPAIILEEKPEFEVVLTADVTVDQTATLTASIDESANEMPSLIGVPIERIKINRFTELKKADGAKIFWEMEAILHGGKLYLLEDA